MIGDLHMFYVHDNLCLIFYWVNLQGEKIFKMHYWIQLSSDPMLLFRECFHLEGSFDPIPINALSIGNHL